MADEALPLFLKSDSFFVRRYSIGYSHPGVFFKNLIALKGTWDTICFQQVTIMYKVKVQIEDVWISYTFYIIAMIFAEYSCGLYIHISLWFRPAKRSIFAPGIVLAMCEMPSFSKAASFEPCQ